ncbi:MAG TPA: GTP-binding protein [Methanomassiliicoccales archaeon]|jgi:Ni2+-binding GTPase involved in maturation of urease and hydrogenase
MRLVVVAGTPGSGKTSVLIGLIEVLKRKALRPALVKIDCLWTDDEKRLQAYGIPIKVGLSRDMCPDHFAAFNTDGMVEWARSENSDVLLVETAGLCLRCAPYPNKCLAVCVIDATVGPNTPLKIGPMLVTADLVVITKGDMVSQAEREVFRERVLEVNPACMLVEANGLTGKGSADFAELVLEAVEVDDDMRLRHTPPLGICTLCAGEMRTGKEHHRGVLRHIDGSVFYSGE